MRLIFYYAFAKDTELYSCPCLHETRGRAIFDIRTDDAMLYEPSSVMRSVSKARGPESLPFARRDLNPYMGYLKHLAGLDNSE